MIPVYRDADALRSLLTQLGDARAHGAEVIVVGTKDDSSSALIAQTGADLYLISQRGRGAQLGLGAEHATRELLWFLHADTQLPQNASALVCAALATHAWGRFDVAFDAATPMLKIVAWMMNRRSRWSGIATGDQGIFVRRDAYRAVGGFQLLPLMEDIALSDALRRAPEGGKPACIASKLITSSRKWQREGVLRTIARMWWWRFRFWRGVHPEILAKEYYSDFG
ncbi:MAG: TIGR04283 family arsenosugar biosynthesis glycosyltransferase [Casimicrobium sp.]